MDNTGKFLIAVFDLTNKLVVIDIATMEIKLKICKPEILLRNVWLDETGCFLSTLDENKTSVDIYIFEWEY